MELTRLPATVWHVVKSNPQTKIAYGRINGEPVQGYSVEGHFYTIISMLVVSAPVSEVTDYAEEPGELDTVYDRRPYQR